MSIKDDSTTWHKALVLAFRKLGIVEMLITDNDLLAIQELKPDEMPAMIAVSQKDGLHLILATFKEAEEFQEIVGTTQQESSGLVLPHPLN